MTIGEGQYDNLCTQARDGAGAEGCILIVVGGRDGSGFSCQAPLHITVRLPALLRSIANQIEADMKGGKL